MRDEFDRYKEQLRQTLITRYKLEPPGGIHAASEPGSGNSSAEIHPRSKRK
jgi:hypothetical protein